MRNLLIAGLPNKETKIGRATKAHKKMPKNVLNKVIGIQKAYRLFDVWFTFNAVVQTAIITVT